MAAKKDPGLPGDPIDLYLRWGLVYGFGSLFKLPGLVGLLIQWKSSEAAQEARRFVPDDASLPGIYLVPRGKPEQIPPFWSITVPVKSLGSFLDAVKDLAISIELAAPVAPSRLATSQNVSPALSTTKVLMAVLDDGCAFANASFCRCEEVPWFAGFLAGQVFRQYRKRGRPRTAVLPDFLIGAHALVMDLNLLTRDRADIKKLFSRTQGNISGADLR